MSILRIPTDLHVTGSVTAETITLPDGSVDDDAIESGAGIKAAKMQHQHQPTIAQESGTTAAAEARVVHVVRGASGKAILFEAGCVTACLGDATVTVDLLKNGSSILTNPITLDSDQAAYETVEAGSFSDDALVDGDVLEVDVSVAAGTGTLGEGVFAGLTLREDAE